VLRANHVVIGVPGKLHAEAVGGLAGLAVADVVGQDDEVFFDIKRLVGAEEDVRKNGVE